MKKGLLLFALLNIGSLTAFSQAYPNVVGDKYVNKQPASKAQVSKPTAEVFSEAKEKWVTLKPNATSRVDSSNAVPDLIFKIKAPEAGTYELSTIATLTPTGKDILKDDKGNPITAYVKLQIDNERPTRRILYDTYKGGKQVTGKFELTGKEQLVKVWLPKGVQLGFLEWKNYNDPVVPTAAQNYVPKIVPPAGHPRIWVNQQSLPLIKSRLTAAENQPAWEKVTAAAKTPFHFDFDIQKEIYYREDVEKAAEAKAFYYLMTNDQKVGKEAVKLMVDYLSVLEFGNVTYGDITREIGRAIYTGSLVYDWCFDLLNKDDKQQLYTHMLKLAREMEIGWPPFMDSIVNGHGNEAQVSRDLLAMSIALYDENPTLYKYTSYTVLEQLVPMRKFEYESPRHNQGVDYGAYRLGWEMHAVWLYYRMTGYPVFDDNIKQLPYFWLYMRLPDGYMLRDGDMFNVKNVNGKRPYWKQPQTMLLTSAYANDPILKGEFERQGGLPDNPVLFLLVNDPSLKANPNLNSLPLTKNFGKVLGGMVIRTGWDNTPDSKDVIAEIKGGGYHFANHQHPDAGALQLFHHGMQLGDIGLYIGYGTPYDYNFNKRSIAHSMMLAKDPNEKWLFRAKDNDGGARFNQRFPMSPAETTTDPWFDNGQVLSASFGPSAEKPTFNYFKADLTGAYSSKMTSYTRGYCFLNLGRTDIPAVIILTDDMTTGQANFTKYWQINTNNKPEQQGDNIVLNNSLNGHVGKTYVNMLIPAPANRKMQIFSGAEANSNFDEKFEVKSDKPEATANRIMISPASENRQDRFLTVFQVAEGNSAPLPVTYKETPEYYLVEIADQLVCMSVGSDLIKNDINLDVKENRTVTLTGLKPGFWTITGPQGKINSIDVLQEKNTLNFKATAGKYTISYGRSY
ncbi:hypothetical protein DVR12_25465 [Chitinophaga silvatica]|uniref:Heparin/heparan-sulfate lyase n=1 Tax=Chitinophaga silvatica TaxID=2282649 RepID=A0A3E1Y2P5_9BACT|nr:hypothetical protein [Chitinophaga silvatica]RFS18958.1 hypothetical protein DVR12_25465 [Chitinophaga silvatica]